MVELKQEFVTYKMADGSDVYGEYSWVTDTEYFENDDEPVEVIKETWKLLKAEVLTIGPPGWEEVEKEIAEEVKEEKKEDREVILASAAAREITNEQVLEYHKKYGEFPFDEN